MILSHFHVLVISEFGCYENVIIHDICHICNPVEMTRIHLVERTLRRNVSKVDDRPRDVPCQI